uniref:Uncharacterized protein n=1 Tax=CrAss-like virus sp. ctXt06 TaxID=2825837 RepID=A0A8S5V759_9CAUD|nr:MAG TPA: hypothetical protein [CrAss-like virus sp. ctXt06]
MILLLSYMTNVELLNLMQIKQKLPKIYLMLLKM